MDRITEFCAARILQECRKEWLFLALSCLIGAVAGVLFADAVGSRLFHLMRMAFRSPVSIVGTAVSVWIPFMVSLFLIVHSEPWLVCLICALYITTFTATGYALIESFDQAGWLIRGLAQFPDLCLIPVLLYCGICRMYDGLSRRTILFCTMFAVVIGMINYSLISPFLANLIEDFETMGRYAIHVGLDQCL